MTLWRRIMDEYREVQQADWIGFVLLLGGPVIAWVAWSVLSRP